MALGVDGFGLLLHDEALPAVHVFDEAGSQALIGGPLARDGKRDATEIGVGLDPPGKVVVQYGAAADDPEIGAVLEHPAAVSAAHQLAGHAEPGSVARKLDKPID